MAASMSVAPCEVLPIWMTVTIVSRSLQPKVSAESTPRPCAERRSAIAKANELNSNSLSSVPILLAPLPVGLRALGLRRAGASRPTIHASLREGHESALGRVDAAANRRVDAESDQGGDPVLSEAAHGRVDQLPDVWGPEGLRRADGGLVGQPDLSGDHNGRRCTRRTSARGFRGLRPVCQVIRQRRERQRFEGERSSPRQSPVCRHWVGRPTLKWPAALRLR